MIEIKLSFSLINIISIVQQIFRKVKKNTFMSYKYLKKYQICKCQNRIGRPVGRSISIGVKTDKQIVLTQLKKLSSAFYVTLNVSPN